MARGNLFEAVQRQLDQTADLLNLESGVRRILRKPMREIHATLPVRMDDGSIQVYEGFRVQYNNAKGPTKGGLRFHPDRDIDAARSQAAWMTLKCSLLDLPLGGAGGGVLCNPKELSRGEMERVSRMYICRFSDALGPDTDVPAPDIYTDPQVMAWMMDEYFKIHGGNPFGVITGKPLALGGSAGRSDAAARGGMILIRETARKLNLDLSQAKMAIQGFGNVGYFAARLGMDLLGCKVVAMSDSQGGIYNPKGLNPEMVRKHKAATGTVVGAPDSESIGSEELLELDVDILIPAALESVITEENAGRIKARIVAELANGPTDPAADTILQQNGVSLIPDILCNSGGVTVSYFEMVQNAYHYYWDVEMVHERLDKKLSSAYHAVANAGERFDIGMRQAVYVVAVLRVVEAMKLRGWV